MRISGSGADDAVARSAADLLGDAAAAGLLLVALLAPWYQGERGVERLDLVVVVGLALLSLTVRHLHRGGHLPPAWTVRRTLSLRLLAGAASGAVMALHLVTATPLWPLDPGPWLGHSAELGVGLVGSVLVAQPRRGELLVLGEDPRAERRRLVVARVLVGACVLLLLVGVAVSSSTFVPEAAGVSGAATTLMGVDVALTVVVLAVPLLGLVLVDIAWRQTVVAVGVSLTAATALSAVLPFPSPVVMIEGPGFVLCFLPAAAVAVGGLARTRTARARWAEPGIGQVAAGRLCAVVAVLAVLQAVQVVLEMVFHRLLRGPDGVLVVAAALLLGGSALLLRRMLQRSGATRLGGIAAAAATLLLGAVTLAVDGATAMLGVTTLAVVGDVGLPVALLVLLAAAPSRSRGAAVVSDGHDRAARGVARARLSAAPSPGVRDG